MARRLVEAFYRREQVKKSNAQARPFMLGIFDDGGNDGDADDTGSNGGDDDGGDEPKTYTEDEVNRLVQKKKAEWEKTQKSKAAKDKKTSDDRIAELEDKLASMEAERTRGELTSSARALLQADEINVSDELISHLVGEDADTTEATVKEFIKMYKAAVAEGVKNAVKGKVPEKGGTSKVTKEDIEKVKNPIERQKLIREHMDLFTGGTK